jgi:hypothetical protein
MRTTITLDKDVAEKAKMAAHQLDVSFKQVINDALRAGLVQLQQPAKISSYRTKARSLGLRDGYNLDNVQELLNQIEGEKAR